MSANVSFSSPVEIYECLDVDASSHSFAVMFFFYLLFFVPLSIFIFHVALQRCRSTSPTANTNTDVFTFNLIVMEIGGMLGSFFFSSGFYANRKQLMLASVFIYFYITPGQILFHILICVERYLAVVHPVLYLGLRRTGGVRVRNVSIGCVWVLSGTWSGLGALYKHRFPIIPFAVLLTMSVVVTSFFSLSVLWTLTRSGPGEARRRDRVDPVKRRAFQTIVTITGALLLRFGAQLLCIIIDMSIEMSYTERCVMLMSAVWSLLPSSYIMPLLFLHRAGKLPCYGPRTEPGPGSE